MACSSYQIHSMALIHIHARTHTRTQKVQICSIHETILSNELQNVSNWLVDNKLSLHVGKTESILFGSKSTLCKSPELNVQYNGTNVRPKSTVKYLGPEIDH